MARFFSNGIVNLDGTLIMKGQLQFIYMVQPTRLGLLTEGPTREEETILGLHFDYLKDLAEKGIVLLAGRTQDAGESSFGIVILQTESEQAAREIMEKDPAVHERVMSARLHPYRIAIPVS